ncbi:hypothetical protein [Mycobacterium simiae]|uniref:hypothetical protein n=1 Tax=Mycobacterium simiae TaxID=1784 RepID=UPI00260F3ED3|nr:hypothetical protein [Mycobacterium simiae]
MAQAARIFEDVTGVPAEWRDIPLVAAIESADPAIGHDVANTHRFFQSGEVKREMEALRKIHPQLLTFERWLRTTGWRGP